jgi:hypothetical protein
MNINELIQAAHKNAVEHGFWEDVNLERTIMLIVSEIGEAIEADRNGCYAIADKIQDYIDGKLDDAWFELNIKDDFEDEVADIFIRIFDLMGQQKLTFTQGEIRKEQNMYNALRLATYRICYGDLTSSIHHLQALCLTLDHSYMPK